MRSNLPNYSQINPFTQFFPQLKNKIRFKNNHLME
ncbi:hypothetical protein BGP_6587 [Beggiatoa sp. PS]|nr:hypothetical protein BGP_6587 [Beggiatoa sp. PS]